MREVLICFVNFISRKEKCLPCWIMRFCDFIISTVELSICFIFFQDADLCKKFLKEESGKVEREGSRSHRTLHDFAESNYLAELSFVRKVTERYVLEFSFKL